MKHKTNLIFLTIISYFMSFNLNAQNIHIKCKRFSDDERSKLIEACKKSCTHDWVSVYNGSNDNYRTSTLSLNYNMFGGTGVDDNINGKGQCYTRCEAEVDLFIKSHCDGYEIDIREVIKALPSKVIGKLYDPNLVYE